MSAARPSHCPCCGVAAAPPGEGLRLHGHGGRKRIRLGPEELGGDATVGEVDVRRYRCLRCKVVIVVAPRGVLPRLRYGAVAIALALALWSSGVSSVAAREEVGAFAVVGHDARRSWASVRRWGRAPPWTRAPGSTGDPPRQRAARVTQWLAGHAGGTGSLIQLACLGALLA